MNKALFLLSIVCVWGLLSCDERNPIESQQAAVHQVIDTMDIATYEFLQDTTYQIPWKKTFIEVHCRKSKQTPATGTILVLPGWNHSTLFWCDKMSFCEKATQAGFNLVMPEMHKSTYTKKYFPETRNDMVESPLLTWLTDTLLVEMQKRFGILAAGDKNYVCGLSSGARGAVLIAMERPSIFKKGAAWSGDYDNSLLASDKVMLNFYGPQNKFQQRWQTEANPAANVKLLKTPFLFIHGKNDQIVKSRHSSKFHSLLKQETPDIKHELILIPGEGHTYPFWNSQVDTTLSYFLEN
ncbi:MAG: prolyl oligopeptidase family serine peptidase [Bacteroidota bacterium]